MRSWKDFRRHVLTGLLAISPLAITLWILAQFYSLVSRTVRPLLRRIPNLTETFPDFFLTLIAFVCFLLVISLIGLFARNLAGKAFFALVERGVERIPIIKSVFSSTKQFAEVFLSDQRSAFREVVLFEYPRQGSYSLGFVTNESAQEGFVNVFLPTTPNPTTGFLLILPSDQIARLTLTVEEGIRMIMSGGAVMTRAQAARLRRDAAPLFGRTFGPEEKS